MKQRARIKMKIKDVFSEIFIGYNMTNAIINDSFVKDIYTMQKDSIEYTNIIESKLIKKRFSDDIKKKYYMSDRDIVIYVKKPYKVGTYRFNNNLEVIIPNNFIILRGINTDLYSFIFVTNYLEKIGIDRYVKEHHIDGNLTISDISNITLPNISKERQMKLSNLINNINERSSIYSTILANDDQIIRYALKEIIGDNND